MCGRTRLTVPFATLARLYRLEETDVELVPRWNVAPTESVAVVRAARGGQRMLTLVRWGLVPAWAKELSVGAKAFNARSETAASKPSFRAAFAKRRCLVLADGFYEWKTEGKTKTPHLVHLAGDVPFAMAGLWEAWTSPNGEVIETCTVLTRASAGAISAIHPRMPIILPEESHNAWLSPALTDPAALQALLEATVVDPLIVEPIDAIARDAANDVRDATASARMHAPPPKQLKLFG